MFLISAGLCFVLLIFFLMYGWSQNISVIKLTIYYIYYKILWALALSHPLQPLTNSYSIHSQTHTQKLASNPYFFSPLLSETFFFLFLFSQACPYIPSVWMFRIRARDFVKYLSPWVLVFFPTTVMVLFMINEFLFVIKFSLIPKYNITVIFKVSPICDIFWSALRQLIQFSWRWPLAEKMV